MTKGSDQNTSKDLHLPSVAVTAAFCNYGIRNLKPGTDKQSGWL